MNTQYRIYTLYVHIEHLSVDINYTGVNKTKNMKDMHET